MNFQLDMVSGTNPWTKEMENKGPWQVNGEHLMKQEKQ